MALRSVVASERSQLPGPSQIYGYGSLHPASAQTQALSRVLRRPQPSTSPCEGSPGRHAVNAPLVVFPSAPPLQNCKVSSIRRHVSGTASSLAHVLAEAEHEGRVHGHLRCIGREVRHFSGLTPTELARMLNPALSIACGEPSLDDLSGR